MKGFSTRYLTLLASSVAFIITVFLNLVGIFSFFIAILFTVSFSMWVERYPERSPPATIDNPQYVLVDPKSQYRLYFLKKTCYQYQKWKKIFITMTAWKVSKYGVISGPYFPVFSPNMGKCRPEITPYLDAFHAV